MILADFECEKCGHIYECFCDSSKKITICEKCGQQANRIISLGKVYTGNQDAPWIKSVLEVVDRENPARHVQDFVQNPNRANYKKWMKGEGLVPLDSTVKGAPPVYTPPRQPDLTRITKEVFENHRKRSRLEI